MQPRTEPGKLSLRPGPRRAPPWMRRLLRTGHRMPVASRIDVVPAAPLTSAQRVPQGDDNGQTDTQHRYRNNGDDEDRPPEYIHFPASSGLASRVDVPAAGVSDLIRQRRQLLESGGAGPESDRGILVLAKLFDSTGKQLRAVPDEVGQEVSDRLDSI